MRSRSRQTLDELTKTKRISSIIQILTNLATGQSGHLEQDRLAFFPTMTFDCECDCDIALAAP
jgi:hypothetical protein